ncbi:MAG: hypothetical protein DSY37_02135 [Hyperthermus sp.]|nr:MAG: hypothetical protein DSY37_02135 [Hyperthermus sp.]
MTLPGRIVEPAPRVRERAMPELEKRGGLDAGEALVLLAVARGVDTPGKIAGFFNASKRVVDSIIARLKRHGLLAEERKFLRRRLVLTERGLELLPEAQRLVVHTVRAAKTLERNTSQSRGGGEAPLHSSDAIPFSALTTLTLTPLVEALLLSDLLAGVAIHDDGAGGDLYDDSLGSDSDSSLDDTDVHYEEY